MPTLYAALDDRALDDRVLVVDFGPEGSHTGRYLRDLLPDLELERSGVDRETAAPSADD